MAITLTGGAPLVEGVDGDGGATTTVTSHTVGTNRLLLLTVINGHTTDNTAVAPSSVTGHGLTWVKISDQNDDTSNWKSNVSVWRAMGTPSPATDTLTITQAVTPLNCLWSLCEFQGTETSGTNGSGAIGGVATAEGNETISADVGSPASTSALFGAVTKNSTSVTMVPGSGFTEIGTQATDSGPTTTRFIEWDSEAGAGHSGVVDATSTPTSAAKCGLVAIEIIAAVVSGPQTISGAGAIASAEAWGSHVVDSGGGPAASIAYRNASVNSVSSTGTSTTIVVDKPSGVVNDDLMLAFVQMSAEATIPSTGVPSGWVFLREDVTATISGSGVKVRTYYKIAASEGTTYTWGPGFTGGDDVIVGIVAYDGCNTTSPIYAHNGTSSDDSGDTTCDAPSITTVGNGWLVTCHCFNPNSSSVNPPFPQTPHSGMTERIDHSAPDSSWEQAAMMVADLGPMSAGPTGIKTSTLTNDDGRNVGVSVTLQPSASTGGVAQTIDLNVDQGGSGGTPVDGCMHGWYAGGNSYTQAKSDEATLGKNFACIRYFSQWERPPNTVKQMVQDGRLVLWSTKPPGESTTSWRQVANGDHDAMIRDIMRDLKLLDREVLYLFHHEPGGNSTQGSQSPTLGTPQDYIDAWKQIHKISLEEEANYKAGGKVYLGYCDTDNWVTKNPNPMYPGNDIIDFHCHDRYNYYDFRKSTGTWKSFEDLWTTMVGIAKREQKPLIIAEWGSHPETGTYDLDQWFRDAASYMKNDPDARQWIKGFCYYHTDHKSDWRFIGTNPLGDSHPYQEASGTATHSGYSTNSGKQGWIDGFVNDSYFVSTPIPLSGSSSPLPGIGSGGIASAEAWGTPDIAYGGVSTGQVLDLNEEGVVTEEAWGTPIIQLNNHAIIDLDTNDNSIASEEAWGYPSIVRHATLTFPKMILEVSFDGGSTWKDLSNKIRQDEPVQIKYGRQSPLARFEAGTLTLTLDNRDRRFEPGYEDGLYSPNIVPNAMISLGCEYQNRYRQLFSGYVDNWEPNWFGGGRDAVCRVSASDASKILAGIDLPGSPWSREILRNSAPIAGVRTGAWFRLSESDPNQPVINRFTGELAYPRGVFDDFGNYTTPKRNAQSLVFMDNDGGMEFTTVADKILLSGGGSEGTTVPNHIIGGKPWFIGFWCMWTEPPDTSFIHVIYEQPSNFGNHKPGLRIQCEIDPYPGTWMYWKLITTTTGGTTRFSQWTMNASDFYLNVPHYIAMWVSDDNYGRIAIDGYQQWYVNVYETLHSGAYAEDDYGTSVIGNLWAGTSDVNGKHYGPFGGIIDEFVMVEGEPRIQERVLAQYKAGARWWYSPWPDGTRTPGAWGHQRSGERIEELLSTVNLQDFWLSAYFLIDDDGYYLGPTSLQGNLLQYIQKIEETEGGAFFFDQHGYTNFYSKATLDFINTKTPQAVYGVGRKAVSFTGATGNYAQTPSDASYAVNADMEIRWEGIVDNWISGGASDQQYLLSNYSHNVSGFKLYVSSSSDNLRFQASIAGNNASASADHTFPNGSWVRIKVVRTHSTGMVTFYMGAAGTDWADLPQIGTPTAVFAGTTIPSGIVSLKVGSGEGVVGLAGDAMYASVKIGATKVAVFDAAESSMSSWISSSNETWTMAGSAWSWIDAIPYESVMPNQGEEDIINEVEIAREGGPTIYVKDQASIDTYQIQNYSATDLMFEFDEDVYTRAQELLAKYSQPRIVISSVKLVGLGSGDATAQAIIAEILDRTLLDRVKVNINPPGGGSVQTQISNIQAITHTISQQRWEAEYELR